MGIVSNEFARARADRWIARQLRPKQPKYGPPIIQRPAKTLFETAARLPRDMQKDVKGFYFMLGKLDRSDIEYGLFIFDRKARFVNYD